MAFLFMHVFLIIPDIEAI